MSALKRYEVTEEEIHALAHCSEHAAIALHDQLVQTNEIPEGAEYISARDRALFNSLSFTLGMIMGDLMRTVDLLSDWSDGDRLADVTLKGETIEQIKRCHKLHYEVEKPSVSKSEGEEIT